jgi:hypothetical protein
MRVTFVRSGGFAAVPGLRVAATVTLDDSSAAFVEAEPAYRRDLDASESERLMVAARDVIAHGEQLGSPGGADRDAYQFAFTLEDGGRQVNVSVSSGSSSLPPSLRTLVDWASRESAAIVRSKKPN